MAARETVVVGRIGRAHGIKGEVSVEPRTDEPDRRFAVGNTLSILENSVAGGVSAFSHTTLTVSAIRWHSGRLLLRFAEIGDRNAAEAARGAVLEIPLDRSEAPEDPDEFYDHQLVGLDVLRSDGSRLGTLTSIMHGAQDLLVIDADDVPGGREVLVPFVSQLVPVVDVAVGHLQLAEVPGLLEPEEQA